MAKTYKMTEEGRQKLQEELEHLKNITRPEIAEKIKIARGYGDLSENSEYDEAKNEQAKTEARIVDIEQMLKNAEIINDIKGYPKKVVVGVKVKVFDEDFGEEEVYKIVGSTEANPLEQKISDESPVGKALLGKKVGDEVVVDIKDGETIKLKVLKISK